jgi:hypothetical protein
MAVIKKSKKFSKVSKKKTMKRQNMKRKTMIGRGREGGGETRAQKQARSALARAAVLKKAQESGFGIPGQSSKMTEATVKGLGYELPKLGYGSTVDPNKLGQAFNATKLAPAPAFKQPAFNGSKVNPSSFKVKY